MSKKSIISLAIVVPFAAILIILLAVFKLVTFSLADTVDSAVVTNSSGKEVINLTQDERKILVRGSYTIKPNGPTIDTEAVEVPITKSGTIYIDPARSEAYLKKITDEATQDIQEVLTGAYPEVIKDYEIRLGKLYKNDDWYGAILVNKLSTNDDTKDFYRFIAHKKDDRWQIVNTPMLVLSQKDFPEVPVEILDDVNSFEQSYVE